MCKLLSVFYRESLILKFTPNTPWHKLQNQELTESRIKIKLCLQSNIYVYILIYWLLPLSLTRLSPHSPRQLGQAK